MQSRSVMPVVAMVASVVAGVSVMFEWGATDIGNHHGLEAVGGSYFGIMVLVSAVAGLAAAGRGLTGDTEPLGRMFSSDLLLIAGAGVTGASLAHALSPESPYTSWQPSGFGAWLAAAMGLVMVASALAWAFGRAPSTAGSVSGDVDRALGILVIAGGVLAIVVPFFGWLTLEVDAETTFIYGALQGGLRGVGLVALPCAVALAVAGVLLVRRHSRGAQERPGGLGAEHLALAAAGAGVSASLGFLFSMLRERFDGTVGPELGVFLYLFGVVLAGFMAFLVLLMPAGSAEEAST